jgi:hypothetical protein
MKRKELAGSWMSACSITSRGTPYITFERATCLVTLSTQSQPIYTYEFSSAKQRLITSYQNYEFCKTVNAGTYVVSLCEQRDGHHVASG